MKLGMNDISKEIKKIEAIKKRSRVLVIAVAAISFLLMWIRIYISIIGI